MADHGASQTGVAVAVPGLVQGQFEGMTAPARALGADLPVLRCDADGRITSATRLARSILGARRSDLVGRTLASLVPHAHRASVLTWLRNERSAVDLVVQVAARPGSLRTVHGRLRRTTGPGAAIEVELWSTAPHDLGADPAAAVAELAAQVQELTRRNEQLREVVLGVAHDVRSPLMGIGGAAQNLARALGPELAEREQETVAQLLHAVGGMCRAIDGILRVAEVDGGVALADVDVDEVVTATLALLAHRIEESGAEVEVARLGEVVADGAQLGSVFLNAIENSVRYRRPDQPLRIRIAAEDLPGWRMFSVDDNGTGIAPADRERVFSMFDRGRASVAGTGIGLTFCQRIVDAHGGRIWVTESPLGGTSLRFTIPRHARAT